MESTDHLLKTPAEDSLLDVIIVGAGISGINSAYRLQHDLPSHSYTILESRDSLGGTWDFWRYPGIRSDSDMLTFGFSWNLWQGKHTMGSASEIKEYMQESAALYGIDKKIRYRHSLVSADWSSENSWWRLTVRTPDGTKQFYARFLLMCTGYYDYEKSLNSPITGLDSFDGLVIHPQWWPEDYDSTGKNIIVIGSGATAVTLVPSLAEKAAKVTMLQRSPTWIAARAREDAFQTRLMKWLPGRLARWVTRSKNLIMTFVFHKICKYYPLKARELLSKANARQLRGSGLEIDPHFTPRYNPWEQRLCATDQNDFFKAIRNGKATVVTDRIVSVRPNGIEITSGQTLPADTIITATGLQLRLGGGVKLSVDGETVTPGQSFLWQTLMLSGVPNLGIVFGYSNQAWTLGADLTGHILCRLLKHMSKNKVLSATPRISDKEQQALVTVPLLDLSSTYIAKSLDMLPKTGDRGPWKSRGSFFYDWYLSRFASITKGLEFKKAV